MPWEEVSIMSSRKEFVLLANQEGANIRALCRQFGISPKTGYKLLKRYAALGEAGRFDCSRQPKTSPRRTGAALEEAVLTLRDQHPAWGGRKLAARLQALGHADIPSPSTITAILRRHDRLNPQESAQHKAWRDIYNLERPHQTLDLQPPIRRYQPSTRLFPGSLPSIEYGPNDPVRKVQNKGEFSFQGRTWKVAKAFHGYPVGLRPSAQDGCFEVYFCQHKIALINLHKPQ